MNSNGKPNENWGRWGGNMPDMQPQNGDMVKPDGKPNDDMMFQPTANNTGRLPKTISPMFFITVNTA